MGRPFYGPGGHSPGGGGAGLREPRRPRPTLPGISTAADPVPDTFLDVSGARSRKGVQMTYALLNKLTAKPGQRDRVFEILVESGRLYARLVDVAGGISAAWSGPQCLLRDPSSPELLAGRWSARE